jgi:hypothetical protein
MGRHANVLDQGPIGRARETCENLSSLARKNRKNLRYEKIDPDPYAKRIVGRVAATPALYGIPVGPAPCTAQADAFRPLEYPHVAVARGHGAKARRRFRRAHRESP